jgi:hypothetical protein
LSTTGHAGLHQIGSSTSERSVKRDCAPGEKIASTRHEMHFSPCGEERKKCIGSEPIKERMHVSMRAQPLTTLTLLNTPSFVALTLTCARDREDVVRS